jgi:hypothetical protein
MVCGAGIENAHVVECSHSEAVHQATLQPPAQTPASEVSNQPQHPAGCATRQFHEDPCQCHMHDSSRLKALNCMRSATEPWMPCIARQPTGLP